MKKLLLLPALILLSLVRVQAAEDIAPMLLDGTFWETPLETLQKGALRKAGYRRSDENTYNILPKGEVTIGSYAPKRMLLTCHEESKCPEILEVGIYNKGDDKTRLDRKEFNNLLKEIREQLGEAFGTPGKSVVTNARDAGVKMKTWRWKWEHGVALLQAHDTKEKGKYKSEFIRLLIQSPDKMDEDDEIVRRSGLKDNVKKEANGDIWIDGIPMVDQGDKGYCLPATVARIFAYYGEDGVDQHALASICDTSALGGTSTIAMYESLKKIGGKYAMRIEMFDEPEALDLEKVIKKYNSQARKKGLPLCSRTTIMENPESLDKKLWDEALQIKNGAMRKWLRPIKKNINQGMPLLWVIPGHMRMIIGYNEKEKTIYYSDTWGEGHEKKLMSMKEAYLMTLQMYVLRLSR